MDLEYLVLVLYHVHDVELNVRLYHYHRCVLLLALVLVQAVDEVLQWADVEEVQVHLDMVVMVEWQNLAEFCVE